MQKKIFSLVLSLFIFFISISNKTIVYANAGVATATTTNLSGTIDSFNNASSALSSAIPLGISLTAFLKINNFVTVEGQKQAQKDFDKLSEQDKNFYRNSINYWEVNQEYYNWTGTSSVMEQNIDELKNISKPYLEKVKKFYGNVNTQIGLLKQQFGLTVAGGVATSAKTLEELKAKLKSTSVSLQVDTDFINQSLEQTKKLDKSISDTYSLTSSLSNEYDKMSYNQLYYTFSSNKSRLDFLYYISDSFIDVFNFDIANPDYFTSKRKVPLKLPLTFAFFGSSSVNSFNDDMKKEFKYFENSYSSYLPYGLYPWVYVPDRTLLFLVRNTITSDKYDEHDIFKCPALLYYYYPSITFDDVSSKSHYSLHTSYNILPITLVDGYIETPFSSSDDVREYKRQYVGLAQIKNRPVKYKINLENLQKGDLSNLEPITKEMVTTFPNVNSTDLPLADAGSLPSQGQVDSEKEKQGLVAPGTQPGIQPNQGINIDLNGFLSNLIEKLKELLKSLFVPSDTFFENKFNSIKDKLNKKFNTDYFSTLGQFQDVGVFPFDDIYVNLYNRNIKIFDFSYFRNNFSNIKKITDPVFYLIFLLFCYNEVYFIIRGVYPLKNKIGDD